MNNDRSIDIENFGTSVSAAADIRQAWYTILHTVPGSDPLRPLFGSNIFQYLDKPVNSFSGTFSAQVIADLEKWEPRCTVSQAKVTIAEDVKITVTGIYIPTNEQIEATLFISKSVQNTPVEEKGSYSPAYSESYN